MPNFTQNFNMDCFVISICICRINLRQLRFVQTMTFAIDEINKSNSLLPNISVGYRIYDNYLSGVLSMKAAMALMNGMDIIADGACSGQAVVQAIIGESDSSPTIALTRMTTPLMIPVVRINYFIIYYNLSLSRYMYTMSFDIYSRILLLFVELFQHVSIYTLYIISIQW